MARNSNPFRPYSVQQRFVGVFRLTLLPTRDDFTAVDEFNGFFNGFDFAVARLSGKKSAREDAPTTRRYYGISVRRTRRSR
jgi:hypothetical protein